MFGKCVRVAQQQEDFGKRPIDFRITVRTACAPAKAAWHNGKIRRWGKRLQGSSCGFATRTHFPNEPMGMARHFPEKCPCYPRLILPDS